MIAYLGIIVALCGQKTNADLPDGGGAFEPEKVECVPLAERQRIQSMLEENKARLEQEGLLPLLHSPQLVSLEWPLRQAAGFDYSNYYGISNYVDHDPLFAESHNDWVLDYHCGNRSYDVSGYNHAGIDIYSWPFGWNMTFQGQVEVVAAAPGVIIGKDDGYFDQNCAFNSSPWNAVYVMHQDGSTAWYGHVRNGSLTTKQVGESVALGEYLATVASSGNSTGPHLHFELYDGAGNLIDPYSGACNDYNADSWWANQKPYYESRVNTVLIGWAPPEFYWDCPPATPENPNASNCFEAGNSLVFSAYFQDQLQDMPSQYRIFRPDGSLHDSWTHLSPFTYSGSWWYWTRFIAADAPLGEWTFEVSMAQDTVRRHFQVLETGLSASIAPLELISSACSDEGLQLTASGGDQYLWSTGETSQTLEVATSGIYYVTVSNSNGCSAMASRRVDLWPTPVVNVIAGSETVDALSSANYLVVPTAGTTYEWVITGGIQLSGGNSSFIAVEWGEGSSGQICVTPTSADACVGETLCESITILPVMSAGQIRSLTKCLLYPNPARERVNIELAFQSPITVLQVQLLDPLGQVIWSEIQEGITQWEASLPIRSLPAGQYFLKVQADGEVGVRGVVVAPQ